jgi:hypothetical protein
VIAELDKKIASYDALKRLHASSTASDYATKVRACVYVLLLLLSSCDFCCVCVCVCVCGSQYPLFV